MALFPLLKPEGERKDVICRQKQQTYKDSGQSVQAGEEKPQSMVTLL